MEEALRHALFEHFPPFGGVRNKKHRLQKQTAGLRNLSWSDFGME